MLLLGRHLRLATRELLVLARAPHGARSLLLLRGSLRLAERLVLGGEPLTVVKRGALERRLGGAHALRLALLARAQFAQALGVHALELLACLLDLAAVLRRLLQARLPHLVVAHAAHLLLHLRAQARLALLLERRHARLGVEARRRALRLHRALVHLIDLCESKRQRAVPAVVVRLRLDLSPRAGAAHVGDALQQAHEQRRGSGGIARGAGGEVPRDGAAQREHSGELLARHHLLVREPALGLEHGQRVAVVLRGEVLHVQAVRRPLPQRLMLGAAAGEHAGVAALQDADQARPERTFQAIDGAGILELLEHLTPELAVRKAVGRHLEPRLGTGSRECGRNSNDDEAESTPGASFQ